MLMAFHNTIENLQKLVLDALNGPIIVIVSDAKHLKELTLKKQIDLSKLNIANPFLTVTKLTINCFIPKEFNIRALFPNLTEIKTKRYTSYLEEDFPRLK